MLYHVVRAPNVDWYPSVLKFTADKYQEYDEWIEQFGRWGGISEHVVYTMNFKTLTYSTPNFLFCSNFHYTKESTTYNICLEYICGQLYPFIKPLPVRDKQRESFLSIYYKPHQVLIKDKDVRNLPLDATPGKIGGNNEPNKYGDPNPPKMPVLNEYIIISGAFLLPPQ